MPEISGVETGGLGTSIGSDVFISRYVMAYLCINPCGSYGGVHCTNTDVEDTFLTVAVGGPTGAEGKKYM